MPADGAPAAQHGAARAAAVDLDPGHRIAELESHPPRGRRDCRRARQRRDQRSPRITSAIEVRKVSANSTPKMRPYC
jgi:hypothetical protein